MWSPKSGWADAGLVLKAHGLTPLELQPKEGLALINGTQLITSLGAEAVERARLIAKQGDVIAAMSLEVHGIVNDTIDFVQDVITTEMNSATDNPVSLSTRSRLHDGEVISGGNFHGEYPAKVLDYLAIGVHELSSMSERRIERLVNPALSELPAFLVKEGGLNSVDSLSTAAGQEDHVSMGGGFAARKALNVVKKCGRREFNHKNLSVSNSTTAGRYVARKIASVFSRPNRQARSSEAIDESASSSVPTSQKYSSSTVTSTEGTDVTGTQASAYEWKKAENSNGTVSHVNGETPARQRVF
ncbi:hypothetical protein OS493_019963 [Desmophyllum pertusum]|uniref:Histidine ammonia-lyase n=1 Tax=Desmophyllum pertusum TaxID=174260 RepID=A0A9X0CK89_9CNID|nr:hypothetical protein OS493_019963 [Desmophyllum pertusum]